MTGARPAVPGGRLGKGPGAGWAGGLENRGRPRDRGLAPDARPSGLGVQAGKTRATSKKGAREGPG